MDTLLQVGLAQIAIALSVFNLITFLWLGLMVLLMGDRRNLITWVGGIGLLLAALFFLCHGALVGAGVPVGALALGCLVACLLATRLRRAALLGGDWPALCRTGGRVEVHAPAGARRVSRGWGCSPCCWRSSTGQRLPTMATSSACSTPQCACVSPSRPQCLASAASARAGVRRLHRASAPACRGSCWWRGGCCPTRPP